ncbi:transporter substrate-binding domain-containing protein [Vibrio sp. S9_S30]|uniref:substrate-binding periplasmic protein n=1 Tax=Vibrio sp. S9_S30 TaxID=2720226 RepID=UPI0016800971|nr:transporter substrate-binding domain-containing protein [Vibrio sp. S9_S30]MBD1556249.1 transporter substrate-binding domain-containing protein [Vibrio sp. S9_S30]
MLKVLLFFFITFALPAQAESARTLRVCWENEEKPPYLMFSSKNKPYGLMVDVVEAVTKENGYELKHIIRPWKRCLLSIQKGRVDLVPNASFQPYRATFSYYSSPIYETNIALFYKSTRFRSPPQFLSQEDISRYRIGGISGFNYSFVHTGIAIDVGAKSREYLVKKLLAERVDFALLQVDVLNYLAKQKKIDITALDHVPFPGKESKAYHVLFSKETSDAEALKNQFNQTFLEMKRNGMINKIKAKYL